ncbi:hypothetical protein [Desulfatitalea alkaliphila]|uniref:Phage Tail Collar Domain n=1 Tax=Desulfatitalea alkaliphila TaxID=2929485 RepID=A0AA41UI24_9BACT|nr:hypothetical protein [Desulfatitalea alkaliphila]MCJ8500295.1 hypothetical protein [Desulfatitalea alkaliphila]
MEELIKKIPVSIIAICIAVLTVLVSIAVIRGDSAIDIWGIKIDPKRGEKQDGVLTNLPVGTILASYLAPNQMKENYGNQWVLANGDEVSTKTPFYTLTGKTKLPDLRGVFIRGLNVNRNDGKQDPDGQNRNVGDFQADDFLNHNHAISTAGIWGRSFKGEDGSPNTAHERIGATENKGGKETRPRNVALYYYIKIL